MEKMDSQLTFGGQDLSCAECHDIFEDLVLLSCGHNICKVCLEQNLGSHACPFCSEKTNLASPHELCEVALQGQRNKDALACSTSLCSLHSGKLNLYCLEDEQLLCVACRTSKTHENHKCCTVDTAADEYKKDLQTALRRLQDRLRVLKEVKSNYEKTAKCIKTQTKKAEQQMKQEFEELHQFLQNEEASRLAALRQEGVQKGRVVEQKNEELRLLISYGTHVLNMIKAEMGSENISFVQCLRGLAKCRAQFSLQEPHMFSGALIDEAKHRGNLMFRVWEKMQEVIQYTSVILDPNTAHPELTVYDDFTSVQRGHRAQHLPNNLERFDQSYCVVGSEAFTSGIISWVVEVTDIPDWEVGVTTASIPRAGKQILDGETWSVKASHGEYLARFSTLQVIKLHPKESLQKIKIQLDWNKGELEFSDPVTDTQLFTFSYSFTQGLYPLFISPCKHSVMRILPVYAAFTFNRKTE